MSNRRYLSQSADLTERRKFLVCLSIILASFCSLIFVSGAAHAEVLKQYRSEVKLLPSGILNVRDRFQIDFQTDRQRNQIIKYIQTRYRGSGKVHDVRIKVKKVLMDKSPETYSIARATGGELQLQIGKSDERLSGSHEFDLEYEVYRAVDFVNGKPQLFFNVTGDQWPFPLRNVSCEISLPRGVDDSSVAAVSFVGAPGNYSQASVGKVKGGKILFSSRALESGKGLAVQLTLPPGAVVLPSALQDLVWHIQSCSPLLLIPSSTLLFLTLCWWLTGRDEPAARKTGTDGWKPPDYLTAAEVGTLIDESCDLSDIVSTVVDLAGRGFIKIRVLPYTGLLYLCDRDYELTLLKSPKDKELKSHERLFLSLVFGISSVTYASSLRGRVAEYLPLVRRSIYRSLVDGGYFTRDPEMDRRNFVCVGVLVVALGLCLLTASFYHLAGATTSVGIMLSGVIIIIAAGAMPRKGARGTTALKEIVNFRNFIVHGDKDRVESILKKEKDLFSRYLAYAIVLGVADRYARIFKDAVEQCPEWYQIDESLKESEFSSSKFVKELGDGLSIINQCLTEKNTPYSSTRRATIDDLARQQMGR